MQLSDDGRNSGFLVEGWNNDADGVHHDVFQWESEKLNGQSLRGVALGVYKKYNTKTEPRIVPSVASVIYL